MRPCPSGFGSNWSSVDPICAVGLQAAGNFGNDQIGDASTVSVLGAILPGLVGFGTSDFVWKDGPGVSPRGPKVDAEWQEFPRLDLGMPS